VIIEVEKTAEKSQSGLPQSLDQFLELSAVAELFPIRVLRHPVDQPGKSSGT
jgi:hypothetical protein